MGKIIYIGYSYKLNFASEGEECGKDENVKIKIIT
jgi:hypothetical protein